MSKTIQLTVLINRQLPGQDENDPLDPDSGAQWLESSRPLSEFYERFIMDI